MSECFSEESIKAIILAQDESRSLGIGFVGTEQLLLGLLCEGTNVVAKVLKSKGVTLEQARIEVEKISGRGSDILVDIPFTPKAKCAFELALEEVRQRRSNYIGAEHVLLGMLRIEDGTALQVLSALGVDATEIRELIIQKFRGWVRIFKGSVLEVLST
jgi:ATP-dependent Clp protease ATP-binding subunit ClpA